jgi:hypothetical protein
MKKRFISSTNLVHVSLGVGPNDFPLVVMCTKSINYFHFWRMLGGSV